MNYCSVKDFSMLIFRVRLKMHVNWGGIINHLSGDFDWGDQIQEWDLSVFFENIDFRVP